MSLTQWGDSPRLSQLDRIIRWCLVDFCRIFVTQNLGSLIIYLGIGTSPDYIPLVSKHGNGKSSIKFHDVRVSMLI